MLLIYLKKNVSLVEAFSISEENGILLLVDLDEQKTKSLGFVRDDDGNLHTDMIEERPVTMEEKYAGYSSIPCLHGTFYLTSNKENIVFVDNKGMENLEFSDSGVYCDYEPTYNGLANSFSFSSGSHRQEGVYDFKNSCYRDDLETVVDLGYNFYAAKKKGEKQFGIYEIADEKMKDPLIMVDKCSLAGPVSHTELLRDSSNNIIYSIGETTYRYEVTKDGKLKPIAKQTNNKDLFLSTGNKWRKIDLKEDTRVDISWNYGIEFERGKYYTDEKGREYLKTCYERKSIPNDKILKFVDAGVSKTQTEVIENPKEGYHNAKAKLKKNLEERKNELNSHRVDSSSQPQNVSAQFLSLATSVGRGDR